MKHFLILVLATLILNCKNNSSSSIKYSEENLDVTTSVYPESITKVFDAHGGFDVWKNIRSLTFGIEIPEGKEITTTDLKNRKSLIRTDKFKIGFNGEKVWIKQDSTYFRNNAKFYYNLMFYFYAMPFVLGDDGINYETTEPLEFEGFTYPGIKIAYESGIGESPDDEYILYYNPKTYKMEWLAYTVTFFTKEKAKEFHFIKYGKWQTIEGVVLPETITWYKYEDNRPTEKRNNLRFTDVKISKEKPEASQFEIPAGATIVE